MPEDNYYFDRLFKKRKKFKFEVDEELLNLILKNSKKSGNFLDLGVGESGIFLELARRNFNVDVLDISKTITKEIKKISLREKLKINVIAKDVRDFKFKGGYDIISCVALLHFLTKEEAYELIKKMKEHTNISGVNIIIAFREGDIGKSEEDSFYVRKSELKSIYSNWNILNYEDYEEEGRKFSFIIAKNLKNGRDNSGRLRSKS